METTQIDRTSQDINISGKYFKKLTGDPAIHLCSNLKTCKGIVKTAHGYFLRCFRGCEERQQAE